MLTKTAMPVVHHHVAPERDGSVVVDATRAVRDVAHDDCERVREPAARQLSARDAARRVHLRTAR
jgi:hypothetical protein